MDQQIGQIAEGFFADLVVLNSNPLKNLETLKKPMAVYQAGKLIPLELE